MLEMQFQKQIVSCLDPVLREVHSGEQTQEIKLPDGMPDIGRVLCGWGQPILRSKEWQGEKVSFSGGMIVWVLYAPEDGSPERCLDAWIPFQMKWDLPGNVREGDIRIQSQARFVDARSVSPRKIMVRAGLGVLAEAFSPMEAALYIPEKNMDGVELKRSKYPLRLPMEVGEKTFVMDEDITLPASAPQPEKVIYYTLLPRITEKKVLANKLVFRGTGEVHLLYRSEEGQLHSWDFSLPFSQFSELKEDHSTDAQANLVMSPTSLELEMDDEGHLRLKAGVVGQYLITDQQMLEIVEDAYSPDRELDVLREDLELPAVLETRRENLYGEQTIPAEANLAADVSFTTDFPRQNRMGDMVEMEVPGMFQVLFYGEDGSLGSASSRWEGQLSQRSAPESELTALPQPGPEPQAMVGSGSITVKGEVPMELTTTARQQLPMVTGVELGEKRPADPGRPSLILRRAGEMGLWELAKASGSTMEAIRSANQLEDEPAPGQMLLIPVR